MAKKFRFKKKNTDLTLKRFIPNIITLSALCVGLTSIKFALSMQLNFAVLCLLVSALLDGTDGRVARYMGVTSHFGAELDSLADFVNFGVSPAVIAYVVSLKEIGEIGWGISLFFIVCSGLRLARFNTTKFYPVRDEQEWENDYSTGVPAPAGAIIAMFPMLISLAFQENSLTSPLFVGLSFFVSGSLMVSKIMTFVFKNLKIKNSSVPIWILMIGALIVLLMTKVWLTMSVITLIYITSIPFSHKKYLKLQRAADAKQVVQKSS